MSNAKQQLGATSMSIKDVINVAHLLRGPCGKVVTFNLLARLPRQEAPLLRRQGQGRGECRCRLCLVIGRDGDRGVLQPLECST